MRVHLLAGEVNLVQRPRRVLGDVWGVTNDGFGFCVDLAVTDEIALRPFDFRESQADVIALHTELTLHAEATIRTPNESERLDPGDAAALEGGTCISVDGYLIDAVVSAKR